MPVCLSDTEKLVHPVPVHRYRNETFLVPTEWEPFLDQASTSHRSRPLRANAVGGAAWGRRYRQSPTALRTAFMGEPAWCFSGWRATQPAPLSRPGNHGLFANHNLHSHT